MSLFEDKEVKIQKKALIPFVFIMPLTGIIISKGDFGALIVLVVGLITGIFIGRGVWKK